MVLSTRVHDGGLPDGTVGVAYLQGFWSQMLPAVQLRVNVASLAFSAFRTWLAGSGIAPALPTGHGRINRTTAPLGVKVNSLFALLAGLAGPKMVVQRWFLSLELRDITRFALFSH